MKKWTEMSFDEKDVLVAEKLLGTTNIEWREFTAGTGELTPCTRKVIDGDVYFSSIPCYSKSMDDVWEVVEKVVSDNWEPEFSYRRHTNDWSAWLLHDLNGEVFVVSPSAPEAICLAALRAVGVDI